MAAEDFFQEIAMTKHPVGESDKEVMPREKVTARFERGESFPYDKAVFVNDRTFEERTEEFHTRLAQMREQYRPFMANHLGYETETVRKQELKEFEFRYLAKHEVFGMRLQFRITGGLPKKRENGGAIIAPSFRLLCMGRTSMLFCGFSAWIMRRLSM